MSLATDFRHDLLQISAISNLVGTRVYPLVGNGHELPSIVYNISGNYQQPTYSGSSRPTRTEIQLDCYTANYADVDVIRQAIATRYTGFTGTIGPSNETRIAWSSLTRAEELVDNSDGEAYRLLIEISLLV